MYGWQVMGDVNGKVDAAQTAKVMQEFARQNEFMNMKEDMIGDALQDAVRTHTRNFRWLRWI
jgi:Arc/MetJ family transcription regulator